MKIALDHAIAIEAKAMVALAFRNGPIEALHAGKPCAVCSGNSAVSHISDEEMKAMMKSAVNTLYRLLWQRTNDPHAYIENLALGQQYTMLWDDPELKKPTRKRPPITYRNP
jgi:hypothetical protein